MLLFFFIKKYIYFFMVEADMLSFAQFAHTYRHSSPYTILWYSGHNKTHSEHLHTQ